MHIVNVSGGAGSAVALMRVIARYGKENTFARFADTNSEHADLYRFLDDLERVLQIPIARLGTGGQTIWDVFERELMFTNPQTGGCIASHRLKKAVLQKHAESIATPQTATIHVGLSIDEDDRIARIHERGKPWRFDMPLCWEPVLWRCDVMDELHRRGLRECSVYEEGYPHANCLRWNCILSGIGQWIARLKDDPEAYADCEDREQRFMDRLKERGRKVQTILRDRRGGETQNLSLRQLRQEVEAGLRDGQASRESTCSCIGGLFD